MRKQRIVGEDWRGSMGSRRKLAFWEAVMLSGLWWLNAASCGVNLVAWVLTGSVWNLASCLFGASVGMWVIMRTSPR